MQTVPTPNDTTADETLPEQIARCYREITKLRQDLAAEVRTNRLVVVDEHGIERILTRVSADFAELVVASPTHDGPRVVITASTEDGDESTVTVTASGTDERLAAS